MNQNVLEHSFDVVVVGGGIAGICTAIASARQGAKTALIQDRPVLGGNASSEVRMHIVGASCHGSRENMRESGILEEILLENKFRNPTHSYAIFDTVLWEKVFYQENLQLFLNTVMTDVKTENAHICSVGARQMTTEKEFTFYGKIFADCTGDGLLSYLAGAEYMYGREAKSEFGEPNAMEKADKVTMGNSILFKAVDAGKPISFKRPFWAYDFMASNLLKNIKFVEITSGFWWVEAGGTKLDVVKDSEEILLELKKIVFGCWDYIKNSPVKGSENLVLDWIGVIPAKREGRRFIGDYILTEQDLIKGKVFDDAVAYGGWHIDTHQPEKFFAFANNEPQTEDIAFHLDDIYSIPYRCLYAKDIDNLMLGGRIVSATHRAFASTRVMGTCAVMGQAAGTAAAMAALGNCLPRDIGENIKKLQQQLLKDDCYIPGVQNQDEQDKALKAKISCSSEEESFECESIINGITRSTKSVSNLWKSKPMKGEPEWIQLQLIDEQVVKKVQLVFDSNLTAEIMPSLSKWIQDRQKEEIPETLVKYYRILFFNKGKQVHCIRCTGNYQRFNIHSFEPVLCDAIRVEVISTHGCEEARIFEIRIY